jgi:uncharacterized RmlC-like cupin family protein
MSETATANVKLNGQEDVPVCKLIRAGSGASYEGKQHLQYFEGVSAQSAGAKALCLTLLQVPPGAQSAVHMHDAHESAAYHVSGAVEVLHGAGLRERVTMAPGDFFYIPAGAPHLVRNLSQTEPATGILARTDPNEQESVVLLPELEAAAAR